MNDLKSFIPETLHICPTCDELASGVTCAGCAKVQLLAQVEAALAVARGGAVNFDSHPGWNEGVGKLWRDTFVAKYARLRACRLPVTAVQLKRSQPLQASKDAEPGGGHLLPWWVLAALMFGLWIWAGWVR